MNKDELRLCAKQQLKKQALTIANAPLHSIEQEAVFATTMQNLLKSCASLFAYMAFNGEVDVSPIIQEALLQDIQVAIPRVIKKDLSFHAIQTIHDCRIGTYGIREPHEDLPTIAVANSSNPSQKNSIRLPLVILVPGLAFTLDGKRLGRGAGYYDRFLSFLLHEYAIQKKDIDLVGVCHSFQIQKNLPTEDHDIPMDRLLIVDYKAKSSQLLRC